MIITINNQSLYSTRESKWRIKVAIKIMDNQFDLPVHLHTQVEHTRWENFIDFEMEIFYFNKKREKVKNLMPNWENKREKK